MRFPWISRTSHDETVSLLKDQIEEMKAERKVIYDRLGSLGLGGPLFHLPAPEVVAAEEEEKETAAGEELERLRSLRFRPSQRADYFSRKNNRDHRAQASSVIAAINQAEALGKSLG